MANNFFGPSGGSVSNPVTIAQGGTGQITQTAAFDALAPTTAKGDLIVSDGSDNISLTVGANDQVLTADSTQTSGIKWSTLSSALDESYQLQNLVLACSVGASALTITLQNKAAASPSAGDPVKIGFRSTTATSGAYSVVSATAATTVVVPSGATLGLNSGTNGYIFVYALNNAGTIELAVSSIYQDETAVGTTTAIGTGSDTAGFYSTSARSGVAFRLIGRLKYNTAPNGTYSAVPDQTTLVSLEALNLFGETQTILSSTKTPTASGNWSQMTTNSIIIQPGDWIFHAQFTFGQSGGAATYSAMLGGLRSANGADTGVAPTALSSTTGVTILGNGASDVMTRLDGVASTNFVGEGSVVLRTDRTLTVFAVPFAAMTTAANARITAVMWCYRLR